MNTVKHSIFWYASILLLGGGAFASLVYLSFSFELLVLLAACSIGALYMAGRPAYIVVVGVIFLSMFINNANYTFLSFDADGTRMTQGPEARLLAYVRLPLVFGAVALVLARYAPGFFQFIRRNWDVVLFAVIPFFSAFFSLDVASAVQYSIWFALSILTILAYVFLLGAFTPKGRWVEHVAWLLAAANLPIVLLALMALPSHGSGGILKGAFSGANYYAYACDVVIAALLVLERQRGSRNASRFLQRIPSIVLLGLVGITTVPLLLSAKRAAIIAAVVVVLVYIFSGKAYSGLRRSSASLRTMMALAIFVAIGWFVLPRAETTMTRFERLFSEDEADGSAEARLSILETSLDVVADNLIFGIGLDNTIVATRLYTSDPEIAGYGAHNTLLQILVEMGLLGLLAFVVVFVRSARLWRAVRIPPWQWGLLLLAIPPGLLALTESNLTPGQAMFWPLWLVIILPRIGLLTSHTRRRAPRSAPTAVHHRNYESSSPEYQNR